MTVFADVVIVGAGMMGCSTAFHLALRKGPRVIVVEKGAVASGQTKRSGALIRTHFSFEPETRLALASLLTFQKWKDVVGGPCGFSQTGLAWLVGGDAGAAELRREVAALQAIGVNTHLVSPSDLRDLQPGANVDDVSLAAFEPESGYADPVAATQSLADRARALGAVFKTGTFLRSIRVNNGRVSGVDTTVGPIETLNVVLTAGPWTDAFLKPLGLEIGIQSVRAQVAFYDRPLELKTGHAAFVDRLTGAHFRPHTFGLTMVGYNDPPAQVLSNPDRLDETVSQDTVADLRQRIAVRLPAMSSARFTRGHAGIYDQSPDGRPILGRVPGIHGLYVGAGLSGNGFAFAPAAGAAIAELVADGEATVADLTPFSIDRFRME